MTISPEAKEAREALALLFYPPDKPHKFEERAEQSIQLAINCATAPLEKEIERLRGEVEKAWGEAMMRSDLTQDAIDWNYNRSRAKRVAEGKE